MHSFKTQESMLHGFRKPPQRFGDSLGQRCTQPQIYSETDRARASRQGLGSYAGQLDGGRRVFPHPEWCGWPVERRSTAARTGYPLCSTSHVVLRCAEGAEGETVTLTTRAASANQSCLLAIALVDSTLKGCSAPQALPR